jgi:hypothetical protein
VLRTWTFAHSVTSILPEGGNASMTVLSEGDPWSEQAAWRIAIDD